MSRIVEEFREWNSPIIGAYLLWQFNIGFVNNHETGDAPVVLEDFVAYTLLTSSVYNEGINGHRQNLASYIRSFTENKESDYLACLSDRVNEQKELTFKAIDIAISAGFLCWDKESSKLFPISKFPVKRGSSNKGKSVLLLRNKALLLGKWFSQVDMSTMLSSLGVIL